MKIPPLHALIATWFGSGLLPRAPGTWGSLASLPFGVAIYAASGFFGLLLASVAIFFLGLRVAGQYDRENNSHDSKHIVIDEVVGQWIALLAAGANPVLIALSFLLFRFFDVTKIWPVNWCDKKLPGALGVMADDVVAGLYAFLVLMLVQYAGLYI